MRTGTSPALVVVFSSPIMMVKLRSNVQSQKIKPVIVSLGSSDAENPRAGLRSHQGC